MIVHLCPLLLLDTQGKKEEGRKGFEWNREEEEEEEKRHVTRLFKRSHQQEEKKMKSGDKNV